MGADESWKTEDLELHEVLEQLIEWQADLMVILKDVLYELKYQADEEGMPTNRGFSRGLSISRGRSQLHAHRIKRRRH